MLADHPFHIAGRKYTEAVRLAGAVPLVVPRLEGAEFDAALAVAHGVMLTGSPSNVHPSNFGAVVRDPTLPLDIERDDWVLPLIPRVLALGMPLLAICRGAQELNVALGGTLHQAVQEVPGLMDHRDDHAAPVVVQYGPAHPVATVAGGLLARITGRDGFEVNSLHGQCVNRLAPGLRVEATAPDGVVEAYVVAGAAGFTLALQWHPEWQADRNPVSMAIFEAFGDAVRRYRDADHDRGRDRDAASVGSAQRKPFTRTAP